MEAKEFRKLLVKIGACSEGREFCEGKSLAEFWSSCHRADWMLWLCAQMIGTEGWPTRQQLVLFACDAAESVLVNFETEYPKDDRPRKAIEAARTWAKGGAVTLDELRAYAASADSADWRTKWTAARDAKLLELADLARKTLTIPV